METFIIFAIILLIIVGFGVQRLKYIQALTTYTEAENFADFGSGRATPRERSPQERNSHKKDHPERAHRERAHHERDSHKVSRRQVKRELKHEARNNREQHRQYSQNYAPPTISQTVIREIPVLGYGLNSGSYYYNPLDRYQAPRYVPTLSPECSDYATDRCTNVVPYSGCWNEVYNNCVDGAPTTCADYVADQCSNSTDFQSCFNFYNRVACPTIY